MLTANFVITVSFKISCEFNYLYYFSEIANSMRPLEPADLEGTDGQLYKGRVIRKVSPHTYNI